MTPLELTFTVFGIAALIIGVAVWYFWDGVTIYSRKIEDE